MIKKRIAPQKLGPQIMGILNVTPDSFSDGGMYQHVDDAVQGGLLMVEQGADWLDIGGESTRPGAKAVSEQEELDRVIPVIQSLRKETAIPISIDTSKPKVMLAAVEAGANMINDVQALRQEGAVAVAAKLQVPVCLMHMQGTPRTMQQSPQYIDIVADVLQFLIQRAEHCVAAGIKQSNIIFDPGFGFGKTLQHNYTLLNNLDKFKQTHYPLLVGMSRKSMIKNVVKHDSENRLAGSIAAATLAMHTGVDIIRVHDVPETIDARSVFCAMKNNNKE